MAESDSSNDNPYTSAVQKFSRLNAIQSEKHRNKLSLLNQAIAENSDEPVKNSRNEAAQKKEASENNNVTSSKSKKKPSEKKNSEPRVLRRSLRKRTVVNYNYSIRRRPLMIEGMYEMNLDLREVL